LNQVDDFFKNEWNYTLSEPSITSFSEDFMKFKVPANFTEFIEK
jgi:uncharacterized protein YifE (UPF0438 family)